MHFDKSLLGCAQAITKVLQCLLTQQQSTPMMMHSAVKAADNTNQVEEESGQSDHESDRTKDDEHLSDANNILMLDDSTTGEEELIHSHTSASDDKIEHVEQENNMGATNGGYCFGNEFYFKIKLMQILHDANAPNYLYQEIIEWDQEAQDANLSFNVLKSRNGLIHQAVSEAECALHPTNDFGDTWKSNIPRAPSLLQHGRKPSICTKQGHNNGLISVMLIWHL